MATARLVHVARRSEQAGRRVVNFSAVQSRPCIAATAHNIFPICQEDRGRKVSGLRHAGGSRKGTGRRVVEFRSSKRADNVVTAASQKRFTIEKQYTGGVIAPADGSQVASRRKRAGCRVVKLGRVQRVAVVVFTASNEHLAIAQRDLCMQFSRDRKVP